MAIAMLCAFGTVIRAEVVDLSGTWRFAADPNDIGVAQRWFARNLPDRIHLPGALQHQGYGHPIDINTPWVAKLIDSQWYKKPIYAKYTKTGNVLVPFFLQPARHYVGPAWYQRDIHIPDELQGKRLALVLERPHWQTDVWLDDEYVGSNQSLGTPHLYELGTGILPGLHRLTIRVDNRMVVDVGSDAHSISDQTQTCWNGIIGRIQLIATSPVWIRTIKVFPDISDRSVLLRVTIGNATNTYGEGQLSVKGLNLPVSWDANGTTFDLRVPLGRDAELWDEFCPRLHRLTVELKGPNADDQIDLDVGLREISTSRLRLTINGRPFMARGTLECCIFPHTGYPAMDVESWLRIMGICKEHGLNHIRFHSWCPPEAAFVAADQLGIYLQVECGIWARAGTRLGYGEPVDQWLYQETERILEAYGNHPSFVFLTHGNEPSAKAGFLEDWVRTFKRKDPRRLYAAATGWGQTDEDQFQPVMAVGSRQGPRVRGNSGWHARDYSEGLAGAKVPIISHEIGQFCAYPDLRQLTKYTGALKPGNLMIFRDLAAANGILEMNTQLAWASGMLQVLCYKEEIEAALRTRELAGFQILDLHDFPGQGTALVGILDAFWDSKGYCTSKQFRRFCNSTVVLARLARRIFTTADTLDIPIEVTHYGQAPMEGAIIYWILADWRGNTILEGKLPHRRIELAGAQPMGQVHLGLSGLPSPGQYKFIAGILDTEYQNDWDLWVYTAQTDTNCPSNVKIVRSPEVIQTLTDKDISIILIPDKIGKAHPNTAFLPIFWNNQLFPNPSRQTLGLLCDPNHPAFALFPTRPYSQWNWEQIVDKARAFDISRMPKDLEPIIQIIDDWNSSRHLALLFECNIGKAKVLICGSPLIERISNPAVRQLYKSLIAYAAGPAFRPAISFGLKELVEFINLGQVEYQAVSATLQMEPVVED